ncbi:uncharacterized protein LOC129582076 [Paramacrobiotus metropolitanus]|uniref:uncharacterized protein LOC129582076 n=1 Tax=Paramacrobiotus metropolitanus TaxID=2943436 RepID=UPI002445BC43|nr:uncharacterized protein LOC129582076 [Paramacrobiotus metropolitanus]
MFGQPFGAATTTAAPTFGTSTFGTSTFGSAGGTLFGQPQPQPSTFGGASTTFGSSAFGQPQPAAATANPFGTTSTSFGAAAAPFGQPSQPQPAQSTGIFGTSTGGLFGQPAQSQPAAQTSMFGQPQQTQTAGLFGAGATSGSLFGQPTGFGSTAGSTFGAPAQAGPTTMFGQPQQQAGNLFGGTTATSGGIFGAQSGNSMFGTGTGPTGTTVKFTPVIGTDSVMKNGATSNIQTKNFCICMMKEYEEKKSMEELRLEDYQANRKTGTATTASLGVFGQPQQPATAGGLFGGNSNTFAFGAQAANKPPFGTNSTGNIFGQPAAPQPQGLFGTAAAPQTNIFGQPQSSGAGLFGQPAATTSAFAFGTNTSTNTFGGGFASQPQTSKPTSLFGGPTFGTTTTTTTAAPLFGTNTSTFAGSSGFGSTFGQPATSQSGGFFGSKPAFGAAPTTSAPSGFGATSSFGANSGIFGQKPATSAPFSFATNTSTTSGFGGFGTTNQPQTSIFGQQQNKPFASSFAPANAFGAQSSTGMFGQPAAGSSVFGQAPSAFGTATVPTGSIAQPTGNVHAQMIEMLKSGGSDTDVLKNLYPQLPVKEVEKKQSQLSRDAINTFIANAKRNYTPVAARNEDTYKYYVAPSSKLDTGSMAGPSGLISWRPVGVRRDEKIRLDRAYIEKLESELSSENNPTQSTTVPSAKMSPIHSAVYSNQKQSDKRVGDPSRSRPSVPYNIRQAFDQEDSGSKTGQSDRVFDQDTVTSENGDVDVNVGNRAVTLSRPDYYTIPSLHKLLLDEKGSCIVENFLIGRYTFGSIEFLGRTDIAGMNLDKIVDISDKEVSVYGSDERPPIGTGLNKKSLVTFENIFPGESPESLRTISQEGLESFIELLRQRVEEMESATFHEYDPETLRLSFFVRHFSKYTLRLTKDDTQVFGKKRVAEERDGPFMKKSPLLPDLLEKTGDFSRRSDDSSKENSTALFERARFLSQLTGNASMAKSEDSGVNAYFAELSQTEETESGMWAGEEKIVSPMESQDIGLEYGVSGKSLTGCLTGGMNCEDVGCVTELNGETLKKIVILGQGLTVDTQLVLEEQMNLYLRHCRYITTGSETVLAEPAGEAVFVNEFCDLSQKMLSERFSVERFTWGLCQVLYGQSERDRDSHLVNRNQCEQFLHWMRSLMREISPVPSDLDQISSEQGPRLLFHCILRNDLDSAKLICNHFKLYDVWSMIHAITEGPQDAHDLALAVANEYLDDVVENIDSNMDESTLFLIKTVMLLHGDLTLSDYTKDVPVEVNVFEGLNWVECLAVSAFCAEKCESVPVTGIWDFLSVYENKAEYYPQCIMPETSSDYPAFWYYLLKHHCRFMTGSKPMDLTGCLRSEQNFDARIKWFLVRLMTAAGESFERSFDLVVISDFAKSLARTRCAHFGVVSYLHLPPDRIRNSEIYSVIQYELMMIQENPDMYEVIHNFFGKSLKISSSMISKAAATPYRAKGDTLEAAYMYFEGGCLDLCREIIVKYALPLLASCSPAMYHSVLGKLYFLEDAVDQLQPYGAFIEMLRLVEDIKEDVADKEMLEKLLEVIELVTINRDIMVVPGKEGCLLEGFINRKVQEAKAFADFLEWNSM